MKKNNALNTIKILFLGFLLSFGVNYVFSAPMNPTPPYANVFGPLNVGPTAQEKIGSLHLTGGGFRVFGPALFDDLVGIGINIPTWPLQVKTSTTNSAPMAFFENNSLEGLEIRHTGSGGGYGVTNTIALSAIKESGGGGIFRPLAFITSNISRIFIETNGQVGIGTIAPKTTLDVNGAVKFGNQTVATLCNSMTYGSQRYNSISNVMEFCSNNGTWISIGNSFGGTFSKLSSLSGGVIIWNCDATNPLTGSCTCPNGFTEYLMLTSTRIGGLTVHSGGSLITGSGEAKLYGCYK